MADESQRIDVCDLGRESFERHPVWRWTDDEDYVQPHDGVLLPTEEVSLFIQATISLGNGNRYPGAISVRCSDWFVYVVKLFIGDEKFSLTWLQKDQLETRIFQLLARLQIERRGLFPISYSTPYSNPEDDSELCGVILDPGP